MLYRLARLALLAELLTYCAIGAWLHATRGWSIVAVTAASMGVILGLRVAFVAGSLAIGRALSRRFTPDAILGSLPDLRTLLRELRSVLGSNFVNVPFPSWISPPEPRLEATNRIPVLLVHGYFANRGFFAAFSRWLAAQGVGPVFAADFPVVFASIEQFAAALDREVERVVSGTGQPRVALVCHSMGGLAARRYLASHGARRVACLVTIASPHAGTVLARLALGANALQMRPGSAFLRELVQVENGNAPCPATSIYSWQDNLVMPQDTSRLPWARNIALESMGHITILQSPRVFATVLEALRDAGVRDRDDP